MKVALTKDAEIEELEAVRDNEVLLMTTKMRGKDAKITEAQLKGDRTTLKGLVATRDRELGRSAAKAVEAAKQIRKLEQALNRYQLPKDKFPLRARVPLFMTMEATFSF